MPYAREYFYLYSLTALLAFQLKKIHRSTTANYSRRTLISVIHIIVDAGVLSTVTLVSLFICYILQLSGILIMEAVVSVIFDVPSRISKTLFHHNTGAASHCSRFLQRHHPCRTSQHIR